MTVFVLKITVAVLICLVVLWLYLICPALRRHPHGDILRGTAVAHRGLYDAEAGIPENSMPAYRRAIAAGYPIELDIHVTLDGQLVVFHDHNPERICGVPGRIERMTLAELRALHLGGTDLVMPTLEEVLELVDGQVPLLIEFKCEDFHTCRRLCRTADRVLSQYEGIYLVQSFFPFVSAWYRFHRPEVCRGQLASSYWGCPDRDKHSRLILTMSGALLFNVFGRPDFISYDIGFPRAWGRYLCRRLFHAGTAGWTIRSQEALEHEQRRNGMCIFEGFLPKEESEAG